MVDDPRVFERLAVVEVEVSSLKKDIEKMTEKLDELLALKAKGAGAFWLATSLFGVGFSVVITYITDWLKG